MVFGQFPPRKIAPRLVLGLGLDLGLVLRFLRGNCLRTAFKINFKSLHSSRTKLICTLTLKINKRDKYVTAAQFFK